MTDGVFVASDAQLTGGDPQFASTEEELFVARQMQAGECAAFDEAAPKTIRAELVRCLLLADAVGAPRSAVDRIFPARLAIRNAIITGELDLRDAARRDGAALPALELENCRIEGMIRLSHARIRRIRLRNCRFPELDAFGCAIEGGVECLGIEGLAPGADCLVNLEGASIGGQVELTDARLRASARPDPRAGADGSPQIPYALNLRCCDVADHVILEPNVEVDGGVLLHSARIGGDIYARGARLIAGQQHALNGQGMQVAGALSMGPYDRTTPPTRFEVRGSFYCGFARIGRGVYLNGALVEHASAKTEHQASIHLRDTRIGGNVMIGAELGIRHHNAGSVLLNQAHIEGGVYADESVVHGVLSAGDAVIDGDILVTRTSSAAPEIGAINLQDATIGGTVVVTGTIGEVGNTGSALFAPGVRVGGNVSIHDVRLHGSVSFNHAEIGRDVVMERTTIDGGLAARPVRVRGSVRVEQTLFGAHTNLEQAIIDGDVRISRSVVPASRWHSRSSFSLQDARIGGELHVRDFEAAGEHPGGMVTGGLSAIRVRLMKCYRGWSLVEARADAKLIRELGGWVPGMPDEPGFAGFLYRPRSRGRADIVLLPGISPPIHDFNAARRLRLSGIDEAAEYLRFFTSYVWGDAGPFHIVSAEDVRLKQLADEAARARIRPLTIQEAEGDGGREFRASATVLFGKELFLAQFRIRPDGTTEMIDDEPLTTVDFETPDCITPFRFARRVAEARAMAFPPSLGDGRWRILGEQEHHRIESLLIAALRPPPPEFSLRDARTERLDDADGRAWSGPFRLVVDGFTYARAPRDANDQENADLWSAQRARLPMREMQYRAAIEEACHRAPGLRRRRLHSHPEWWIVEMPTVLSVDASGGQLGMDRLEHGIARFLWRQTTGQGRRIVAITGSKRDMAAIRELGPATMAADASATDAWQIARDTLCLQAAGRDDGPEWLRLSRSAGVDEAGDTANTASVTPAHLGFELIANGTRRRGTWPANGGSLADLQLGDPEPTEFQLAEVGPYHILRRAGEPRNVFADSPWNSDTWEYMSFEKSIARRIRHEWMMDAQILFAPDPGPVAIPTRPAGSSWRRAKQRLLQQLHLEPSSRVLDRLAWLRRQYDGGRPTGSTFPQHPYEVAAAAFRTEGENEEARRVLSHKLQLKTRLEQRGFIRRTRQLFSRAFGFFFDHGLSRGRAIATTLGLFLVGWAATAHLNAAGLLVVDFEATSTMAVASGSPPQYELGALIGPPESAVPVISCGRNISNPIFAADVMVPILNFGQEHRCQIASTRPAGVDQAWLIPELWKYLQTAYAILGATCVSIMILTVSGVLRRQAES